MYTNSLSWPRLDYDMVTFSPDLPQHFQVSRKAGNTSDVQSSELFIQILINSFEHASLTCCTLLSPSITFSLFHSELKTYLCQISYPSPVPPYSVSVWRTDLTTQDLLPDSLLIGFTFWFHCFLNRVIPHVRRQTKLASSLVVNSLMQANLLV